VNCKKNCRGYFVSNGSFINYSVVLALSCEDGVSLALFVTITSAYGSPPIILMPSGSCAYTGRL
jgi:hypothetical protein